MLREKALEPPVETQKHSLSVRFPPGNHSDVSSYLSQPLHSSTALIRKYKLDTESSMAKLGNSSQSGLSAGAPD